MRLMIPQLDIQCKCLDVDLSKFHYRGRMIYFSAQQQQGRSGDGSPDVLDKVIVDADTGKQVDGSSQETS